MSYKIEESLLTEYSEEIHEECVLNYMEEYRNFLDSMPLERQRQELISKHNRIKRSDLTKASDVDICIEEGDVCYLDYGCTYRLECAYQHMGLVLKMLRGKMFVVPLTSNTRAVADSQLGKKPHLHYLGKLPGLHRSSCLFLNDAKFLNPTRVIHICSYLDPKSKEFQEILEFYSDFFSLS